MEKRKGSGTVAAGSRVVHLPRRRAPRRDASGIEPVAPARERAGDQSGGVVLDRISQDNMPAVPSLRAMPDALGSLARHGFSEEEITTLVVPKRTLARRRAAREPLTVEE